MEMEFIGGELDLIADHLSASNPPNEVDRMLQIGHESDFEQMKVDIGDIQEDLRKIKARLGIIYYNP